MKSLYIILAATVLMAILSSIVHAAESDSTDTDEYYHRPNKMYSSVQVICQAGYTFVLATMGTYRGQGIAITQVYKHADFRTQRTIHPQPIPCQ